MKKSQVTIFALLGVIILVIAAFVLAIAYINPSDTKQEQSARLYMEQCMEQQFERVVRKAGETGGRFNDDYYNTSLINDSLLLEKVEDRIIERMNVQECLDSFNNHSPHTAELQNPTYSFTHTVSSTILRVKDPYKVTIANTTEQAQPMQLELRIRLEKLVNRTNILIEDLDDGYISRVETDRIDIHVTQQDDYLLWLLIDGDYRFRFVTGTM